MGLFENYIKLPQQEWLSLLFTDIGRVAEDFRSIKKGAHVSLQYDDLAF